MKIAIACDHGAFTHKEVLKKHLEEKGYEVLDFGTCSEDSMDYPDTVYPAAKSVANQDVDFGIVMCGTGIGASIVANKVKGVRCSLIHDVKLAAITREHNNSNVLAIGARVVNEEEMLEIVKLWLTTPFSFDKRHVQRLNKITEIEEEVCHEG